MLDPDTLTVVLVTMSAVIALLVLVAGIYYANRPLTGGLSFAGKIRPVGEIHFLRDLTWVDEQGQRQCEQQIFDALLEIIRSSRRFILLDMFLFNDFTGWRRDRYRPLAHELTTALIEQQQQYPDMRIVFITDPVNTVYGGMVNPYLDRLKESGVEVVETRLEELPDSNLFYSPLWRVLLSWSGNGPGGVLPNPFGPGRVSVRSYLRMLNFKANHRKVVVADGPDGYAGLVTSANSHDGSSAHGNVGLWFSGAAVRDLLQSEQAVPGAAGATVPEVLAPDGPQAAEMTVQVLTEGKIKKVLLDQLRNAGVGDRIDMIMFYLADRDIIRALKKARRQGAGVRILLDPNKDAFGRVKSGMPNRQAAAELVRADIAVRWALTGEEQQHSKMVMMEQGQGKHFMLLGSANLTRRNLDDLNLETDVAVRGGGKEKIFSDARNHFRLLWTNPDHRRFSAAYEKYADESVVRFFVYRILERTGMCTF
ncbi:MAG: phospholipase D-like domain-containing protein [Desulfobulbaceae bacterium]|nr:phospholipase D-like domain-containing protein [Desulfobulbaceae bacterium]